MKYLKKNCAVALLSLIILLTGCGNDNPVERLPENLSKIEVTALDVDAKLKELSVGLSKDYDDMEELTYYRAPIGEDMSVLVMPYVVVDKNYQPTLMEHLQYFGSHIIKFDTLYIKSADKVSKFRYGNKNVTVPSNKSEGYGGIMSNEVYDALKAAVESGYVRVRMEGNAGIEEKELSEKEIAGIKAVFAIYEYLNTHSIIR